MDNLLGDAWRVQENIERRFLLGKSEKDAKKCKCIQPQRLSIGAKRSTDIGKERCPFYYHLLTLTVSHPSSEFPSL